MAYYRRKSKSSPLLFGIALCVLGALALQTGFGNLEMYAQYIWILIAAVVVLLVILFIGANQWQIRRLRALQMIDIDKMDGFVFENYLSQILRHRGYTNVSVTVSQGDYGADILATKDGKKFAIQAKRWKWVVGVEALYQCFGGQQYYGCDACMVITNSTFTEQAKQLARKSKTVLIDREILADWIIEFQKK